MKPGIVVFLLTIFSFQAFYQAGVVIWFHANRAYIASVLCENKARPEMKCKGNCVLNKKVKQSEGAGENSLPASVQKWVEISPCLVSEILFSPFLRNLEPDYPKPAENTYAFQLPHNVFHPPIA